MDAAVEFLRAMAGERAIEVVAVLLGFANIALLIRRSILNYPFGLAMVTLYAIIFFEAKLYADAGLQLFFFAIQIYGWINWARAREEDGRVIIARAGAATLLYAVAALGAAGALGLALDRFTDSTHPYPDAAIASLSIAAQVMMARRLIENWLFWIAVDMIAIGLFWAKGLQPTAALYGVFLLMCVVGWLGWRSAAKTGA